MRFTNCQPAVICAQQFAQQRTIQLAQRLQHLLMLPHGAVPARVFEIACMAIPPDPAAL